MPAACAAGLFYKILGFHFLLHSVFNSNFFLLLFNYFENEDISGQIMFLADPGEDRGCSTNTSVIHSLIQSWFVKISLRCRRALMVEKSAVSHKIDYVTII